MNLFRHYLNLRNSLTATFRRGQWRKQDGELTDDALRVLDDLKKFCGAGSPSIVVAKDGHIDTHATCYAEGKRAVLMRLMQHLHLNDEQLMSLRSPEVMDDE